MSEKVVVHIHTFLQKARRTMKSERGEANYFSTVFFIFIAVVLLAFIIDLFGIISYNNNYGLRRGSQPRLFPSQSRSC